MRYTHFAVCLLLILTAIPAAVSAQDATRVTVESYSAANSVSGPGAGTSTFNNAGGYVSNYTLHSAWGNEKSEFSFDMAGRYTADPTVDPTLYSFTNLRLRMAGSGRVFNAGDTFESFSQYSLSSGLKGLSYKMNEGSTTAPAVTFVYGYAYPRWDGFNPSQDTRSMKRLVYGANVRKSLSPYFTAGLSLVRSDDSDRVYASDTLYDTDAYSFDWEYKPIPAVSIRGESCLADTTLSPGGAADSQSGGSAHRVVFSGDNGVVRLTSEYERVSPGFYSSMGSASRDREKVKVRWRQKMSSKQTVQYGLLWFRDNLSNNKAYTTDHYRPEIGYTFRNVFNRRSSSADVNLMLDRSYGGGNSVTNSYLTLGYRDRFGNYDADFNVGYTNYDSKLQSHSREYVYNTAIGSRTTRGNTIVRPSLNLGGSTISDELTDLVDQMWNYSMGLVVEVPSSSFRSALNIGQNKLTRDAGNGSAKWYGTLDLRYKPKWLEQYNGDSIYIRAFINDYNYSVDTNNFRESGIVGGLNLLY